MYALERHLQQCVRGNVDLASLHSDPPQDVDVHFFLTLFINHERAMNQASDFIDTRGLPEMELDIKRLEKEYASLKNENASLKKENAWLKEKRKAYKNKLDPVAFNNLMQKMIEENTELIELNRALKANLNGGTGGFGKPRSPGLAKQKTEKRPKDAPNKTARKGRC